MGSWGHLNHTKYQGNQWNKVVFKLAKQAVRALIFFYHCQSFFYSVFLKWKIINHNLGFFCHVEIAMDSIKVLKEAHFNKSISQANSSGHPAWSSTRRDARVSSTLRVSCYTPSNKYEKKKSKLLASNEN